MQKLVVTGVDRPLGANLAAALADRFDVVGLSSSTAPPAIADVAIRSCDPDDPHALAEAVEENLPHWVIHCGACAQASWESLALWSGSSRVESCELSGADPEIAQALATSAVRRGYRLTVLSTDAVFAGPRLFHEENDAATAEGPLPDASRRLESAVEGTPTLIVRACPYGWQSSAEHVGWAERLWRTLADAEHVAVDAESHATPILDSDLAELLEKAYCRGLEGLYHMTGGERTSPYRFAVELAAVAGLLSEVRIEPLPIEASASSTAPAETSLGTRRARRQLKAPMPLLREGLERFVAQATPSDAGSANRTRRRLALAGRAA